MKNDKFQVLIRIAPLLIAIPVIFYLWRGKGEDALEQSVSRITVSQSALKDKPVPLIELSREESWNGNAFKLEANSGKATIVHFWATWCGPCVIELPALIQYAKNLPNDWQIIAIAVDKNREVIEDFFTRYPHLKDITKYAHVGIDPGGRIANRYGTLGLPESFLVRKNLTLSTKLVGPQPWTDARMKALLDTVSKEN